MERHMTAQRGLNGDIRTLSANLTPEGGAGVTTQTCGQPFAPRYFRFSLQQQGGTPQIERTNNDSTNIRNLDENQNNP
jgi:hypothetical protein